ncbi:hypothetical protein [Leisingera sp. M523]|uniref:hypothetical protein n=1 Tax=Leisingera sp. M523 TaxID=2867013 RepID=UPI0021A25F51|nr:hypothetical protein [Leisingera sp. M523]
MKIVEAVGTGDGNSMQKEFYNRALISLDLADVHAPPEWDSPSVTDVEAQDLMYKSVKYLTELSNRSKAELSKADRSLLVELKTLSAVTGARIGDLLSD